MAVGWSRRLPQWRQGRVVATLRSAIRMSGSWAVQFMAAIAVLLPWPVQAEDSSSGTTAPTRPSFMAERWEP